MVNWTQTAFVFPGQGSQVVGMGSDVAEHYPIARETFEEADDILGYKLSEICWRGPEELLNDTMNTQRAMFVCASALLRVIQTERPAAKPAFLAGHSLGEFTALVAAGVMSFSVGMQLVAERSRLMKEAGEAHPGAMAALLGMDTEVVRDICAQATAAVGGPLVIANDNCPGQLVISGDSATLDYALELAKAAGGKRLLRLAVSVAAHSPLMKPAADAFKQILASKTLHQPHTPVYANVSAEPLRDVVAIRHELEEQITETVHWSALVSAMIRDGAQTFVEIGSKDVLTGLLRRIDRDKKGIAVNSLATLQQFLQESE